ncbi:MAG: hypothetical protein ACP5KN_00715 [Armatimonadota bacterium]
MDEMAVAAIVGAAVVTVVALVLALRAVAKRREAEADDALIGERILLRDPSANLMGVQSAGMGQVRGNGVLSLTEYRLHFLMWLPRREVVIPLSRVTGIETPEEFMGKSKHRPLLQVNFTGEEGHPDAAAWAVRKLPVWRERIEQLLER